MTANSFRKLALGIPGAVEKAHVGHPDFRLNNKVFASLGAPSGDWGMVKLAPAQQRAYIEANPDVFRPCAGAWGRQGYTNVLLKAARVELVRSALTDAAKNFDVPADKRLPRARRGGGLQ